MRTLARARFVVVAVTLGAVIACSSSDRPPPLGNERRTNWDGEPHAGNLDEAYVTLCETASDCRFIATGFEAPSCIESWSAAGIDVPAECENDFRRLVGCVLADVMDCQGFCSRPELDLIACGVGGRACVGAFAGRISLEDFTESVLVTQSYCGCPGELAEGSAPGATCARHTDCAEVCCDCDVGTSAFSTRVCKDFECAAPAAACAEARAFFDERLAPEDGMLCPP